MSGPLVFIDELEIRGAWRYGESNHLLPDDPKDPAALDALHALAVRAGLKRAWFQDERWPHYDCAARIRAAAVAAGAIEIKTKAWMWLQKFRKVGAFREYGTGVKMEIGKWYVISDSGSAYSSEGFASEEAAFAAALAFPEHSLDIGDITIQGKAGGGPREPLDDPNLANVVKSDALLLFWLLEDYFPFVQSQREPA